MRFCMIAVMIMSPRPLCAGAPGQHGDVDDVGSNQPPPSLDDAAHGRRWVEVREWITVGWGKKGPGCVC
jgi:hypothetical protein